MNQIFTFISVALITYIELSLNTNSIPIIILLLISIIRTMLIDNVINKKNILIYILISLDFILELSISKKFVPVIIIFTLITLRIIIHKRK